MTITGLEKYGLAVPNCGAATHKYSAGTVYPTLVTEVGIQMHVDTDLLLIGGGSAGCLAAIAAREQSPEVAIIILEKGGDLTRNALYWSYYEKFIPNLDQTEEA